MQTLACRSWHTHRKEVPSDIKRHTWYAVSSTRYTGGSTYTFDQYENENFDPTAWPRNVWETLQRRSLSRKASTLTRDRACMCDGHHALSPIARQ